MVVLQSKFHCRSKCCLIQWDVCIMRSVGDTTGPWLFRVE
uniref:Uncharacterized protein n=1 Tax=Anguilla anguilla TaxID=7936 RepID=A0A0E9W3K1_ANGAN